jgi:hypothetical protein
MFVSQTKYAKSFLENFRIADCKAASTPMEVGLKLSSISDSRPANESAYRLLVGNLINLIATILDLSFKVSYISRFMTAPQVDHCSM